ncbi:hypothetical protein ACFYW1_10125 [Streptomyces sp. NPDC002669]|uniref:hypothetical protein n=1 Tax=Streptomyces sp. NPDC002669 TaxID=3364658 RepID=UPI0036C3B4EA
MDFFTADKTYMWRPDGYKAPEQWRYFKCAAVTETPGTAVRIAFGFITTGSLTNTWTPTGLGEDHWANGWIALPDDSQQ